MKSNHFHINRRNLMTGAVAIAAGASTGLFAGLAPAAAAAPKQGPYKANWYRFNLGGFEVTSYTDGMRAGDGPHPTFGANQTPEAVAELAAANFLPADKSVNYFNPVLVNTGKELVLFDTGLGAGARPGMGNLTELIKASGYTPEQVDIVVLTHMHGDHVGGMMENGAPAFANARYVTGAAEFDYWSKTAPADNRKAFDANVAPFAEKFTFLNNNNDVVTGITAIDANGHTPGHMIYNLQSEGKRLVITADTCNHYVFSMQKPDWEVRFDNDKAMAAKSRRMVLGMLAADKVPFIGYHMPTPGAGFVEAMGDGFRFVPASFQLDI